MNYWDRMLSVLEPAATVGSAMAADVPAGLAGLAGLLFEGYTPEEAAAKVEEIRERLTYLPRSEAGVGGLETVGKGLETAVDYGERAAEAVTGTRTPFQDMGKWAARSYGPGVATALHTAPEAISSALGFRAGQAVRAARRGAQALPAVAADVPRLPHAQRIQGVHFSNVEGLNELDPGMYGKGARGAEASRLQDAPDIRPRSHFYLDERERGERGTGAYRYRADLEDMYDLSADPEGIRAAMRARFTTPETAQINPGRIDWASVMNETERRIRDLGYGGYFTPGGDMPAAVAFRRTRVAPYPVAR